MASTTTTIIITGRRAATRAQEAKVEKKTLLNGANNNRRLKNRPKWWHNCFISQVRPVYDLRPYGFQGRCLYWLLSRRNRRELSIDLQSAKKALNVSTLGLAWLRTQFSCTSEASLYCSMKPRYASLRSSITKIVSLQKVRLIELCNWLWDISRCKISALCIFQLSTDIKYDMRKKHRVRISHRSIISNFKITARCC